MRIVFLTGIWPPDVGGPATHGPDFAAFLRDRGHAVYVFTMADGEPAVRPVPVEIVSRRRPFVVRYPELTARATRAARGADLIYATATYAAAAVASATAGRPLVVKLVSDPAYERARRYGLYTGALDGFESDRGRGVRALRMMRTAALRRACRIVVPSRYLAEIAAGWGLNAGRIEVVSNPAPPPSEVQPESLEPRTFVFVGRLTAQKALHDALDALAAVPAARLLVIGDGPERSTLEAHAYSSGVADRAVFLGALPRDETLRYAAGAHAALLSSAWENLPHGVIEALSLGTPVVATAVGGVPEVVRDGENGLLVPPSDPVALAGAMRSMLDDAVRARLAAGARPSVAALSSDAVYLRLEAILASVLA